MIRNPQHATEAVGERRQAALAPRAGGPAICERLGISRVTLWRWRQQPDFPAPVAVGHVRLYDLARLEEWLRAREARVAPAPAASPEAR